MSEYQPLEWGRPLSAQVAGNAEVMFVAVTGHETSAEDQATGYLPLEAMPGVRDVDRLAGLVRTEEGRTVSIAQFLGHGGLRSSLER